MHSLFEEQIVAEGAGHVTASMDGAGELVRRGADRTSRARTSSSSGRTSTWSTSARSSRRCSVPVIGSLNGTTAGGWLDYAKQIEQAGADALELQRLLRWPPIPTRPATRSSERTVEMVAAVQEGRAASRWRSSSRRSITRFANVAKQLDAAGADGLVLFNRFYQPDIDVENLEVESRRCTCPIRASCCCGCAGWRSWPARCRPTWSGLQNDVIREGQDSPSPVPSNRRAGDGNCTSLYPERQARHTSGTGGSGQACRDLYRCSREMSCSPSVEEVDRVGELAVECWFTGERDRHMFWIQRLLPPLLSDGIVENCIIPGKRLFLEFGNAGKDCFRRTLFFFDHFVFKRAPAEKTSLVAAQGGCHLDAAVAVNPVELVLVAHVAADKCPFAPHAGLERCCMKSLKKTGIPACAGHHMVLMASIPKCL